MISMSQEKIQNRLMTHITKMVHQEEQKTEIIKKLDHKTAFVINDFVMKFLSQKYRESMAKWFKKSGHGMNVM